MVLFCAPKEYQKSARYFRSAGGTAKGLLAPWNPKEVDKPLENREIPAYGVKISFRIFRGLLICGAAAEKKQKILRFIAKVDEI